jgi:large subunit ribosomal protein L22
MADTATRQEVRAVAKWVRTSPRKARLVVEHIRGRSVPEARTVLAFTTRAAARDVEKVLRSAIANAEANHGLVGDDLYVSEAFVDEGPTLKRWRARARGRAARIHKYTCHITVKVAPIAVDATRAAKPAPPTTSAEVKPATTEKPARKPRSAAKPKATKSEEPHVADPKAEAAKPAEPAAEKPKRTRVPRRKKTEEAEG